MEQTQVRSWIDGHCHLDRAWTAEDKYWEHARLSVRDLRIGSLKLKQSAMGKLHMGLAYESAELLERMRAVLEAKLAAGEREVWACIDTSPDIGMRAIEAALTLKSEFASRIELKIGAYPIFGFKTPNSDRYQLIRQAAPLVDFLVGLPERDAREGHEQIGFNGHIKLLLAIAHEFHLPVHFHLDQANVPTECGTKTLIQAVRWLGSPEVPWMAGPTVWGVHLVSTSALPEDEFKGEIVWGLREYNIGVIVCPHAAISMRQIRPVLSPTRNSIVRVRELAVGEVTLGFGTDNIGDIFVGLRRPDLGRELELIGSAVRFDDDVIWGKIASGTPLDDVDIDQLQRSLDEDQIIFNQYR
jgi:hypothetical protein